MRLARRFGVVAWVAMLAACSDATGIDGEPMDLSQAQRLWEARQVDDYRMTVRLGGAWISGTAVIQVRDGITVSVQSVGDRQPLPVEEFASYDSVEDLFAVLQYAVEGGADGIDAQFHSRYGVPVQVHIDPSSGWLDDEHGFWVESFQPD
jgi:Family of unknown function (DUF6174)